MTFLGSTVLQANAGVVESWEPPEGTQSFGVLNQGPGSVNITTHSVFPSIGDPVDGINSAYLSSSGQVFLFPEVLSMLLVQAISNQMLTVYVAAYGPPAD